MRQLVLIALLGVVLSTPVATAEAPPLLGFTPAAAAEQRALAALEASAAEVEKASAALGRADVEYRPPWPHSDTVYKERVALPTAERRPFEPGPPEARVLEEVIRCPQRSPRRTNCGCGRPT